MIGDLHLHRGYSLRLQESEPLKNNGIISSATSLKMERPWEDDGFEGYTVMRFIVLPLREKTLHGRNSIK